MAEIRVRNWDRFQHYKDRNPPWIKLHYDILSSKDWVMLDDDSKLLAIVCMLLASRNDGFVPDDPEFIQRVSYLKKKVDLSPLIECGFLEADASTRKQMQAKARPEKRREEKRRGEVPFSSFWDLYPRHEKRPKAETTWKNLTIKDQKAAMAALPSHIEVWDNPKYIPHATSWLNQKRWEDDLGSVTKPSSNFEKEVAALAKRMKKPVKAIKAFYEERGFLPFDADTVDG